SRSAAVEESERPRRSGAVPSDRLVRRSLLLARRIVRLRIRSRLRRLAARRGAVVPSRLEDPLLRRRARRRRLEVRLRLRPELVNRKVEVVEPCLAGGPAVRVGPERADTRDLRDDLRRLPGLDLRPQDDRVRAVRDDVENQRLVLSVEGVNPSGDVSRASLVAEPQPQRRVARAVRLRPAGVALGLLMPDLALRRTRCLALRAEVLIARRAC